MTISSEIERIQDNIKNAYTACSEKGATLPTAQNSNNLATCISSITTGGGGSGLGTGEFCVKVYDYDGTLLKVQYLNSGETFDLPEAPTHTGLTFQEWSSTKPIVNNQITVVDRDVLVGAIYDTSSGMTEIDIEAPVNTAIYCYMNGTKDWGDGTTDTNTSHTYSTGGLYTIKCNGSTFASGINYGNNLIGSNSNPVMQYVLRAVRFSSNVSTIPKNVFAYCKDLKYVSIPKGVVSLGGFSFQYCYMVSCVILPSTLIEITDVTAFMDCRALEVFISSAITSVPQNMFKNCTSLSDVILPDTVTSIGANAFDTCYSMSGRKSIFPNALTSIGASAFANTYNIENYDFSRSTTIPTLADKNAFYLRTFSQINVPADLYSTWITSGNWASINSFYFIVKS